jgi:hypothetical protein
MPLSTTTLRSSRLKIGIGLFWITLLVAGIAHTRNHLMEVMLFGWFVILALQFIDGFQQRA